MQNEPLVTMANRCTLAEAGRMAGVAPPTVFRWIDKGIEGVTLKHARLGRRLFTSEPALTQFMNEVAEARQVKTDRELASI